MTQCTLTGTTNGARIKTYHDSIPLVASGIVYEDIVMNDVANPIIIDQHYNSAATPKVNLYPIVSMHAKVVNYNIIQ